MTFDPSPFERKVLEKVECQTELCYRRIGGIPTNEKDVAEAVLPILARLVAAGAIQDAGVRAEIYSRFASRYAYDFFSSVISWWRTEADDTALDILTQVVARLAKPQDGEIIWRLCREVSRPCYVLLAKLATFPSVAHEVRTVLVDALKDPTLSEADLYYISEVDDLRIRNWFAAQVNSPNQHLRTLARRVGKRKERRLPKGVDLSAGAPERRGELWSAEIALGELEPVLEELAHKFNLRIPVSLRHASFLLGLEPDRWACAFVTINGGGLARLWYRLEDIDTVEVVVTKESQQ